MKSRKHNTVLSSILLPLFFIYTASIYPQQFVTKSDIDYTSFLNWGYNYDSTLVFLKSMTKSPFVKIDSIGSSVRGKAIWMITIKDTSPQSGKIFRTTLHARTHPSERQSQWLTQKIVEKLIGNSTIASALRSHVIFNIVPMYNPDGVELTLPRENSNGVDLERNWFVSNPQPEVAALKKKYFEFMNSSIPIRVALNMHGDNSSKGYFVYHHEKGTSALYTVDEKNFISLVRSNWPEGIADWNQFVSWTDGTPLLYPESWFWVNYHEAVMALTVEEIPVPSKNDIVIEKTANALLNGLVHYLGIATSLEQDESPLPINFQLSQNYPNPFNPTTAIMFSLPVEQQLTIKLYDLLGSEVKILAEGFFSAGNHTLNVSADELASGVYIYRLQSQLYTASKKLILLK